jgi:hypothetical protein
MHGFIEGNVLSRLNSLGDRIIVEDILKCLGVAKEDASAGVGDELIRTTWTGRKSVDTTAKHAKEMEVRLFTSTHFVGGSRLVGMDGDIVKPEPVVEGIWPELRWKGGTTKHGAKGVTNRLVRTFTRTILMGGSTGSTLNGVTSILKQLDDLLTAAKFPTKIKTDILVGNLRAQSIQRQPAIDEVNGRRFVTEHLPMQRATVMVSNQTVTSFAIQTHQTSETVTVSRFLHHKPKVNRNTLKAPRSMTRIGSTASSTAELSAGTDRARVKLGGNGHLGHATGVFVEIRDTAGVKMTETLMPQETELITGDVPKVILLVVRWGKQELSKSGSRHGTGSGSGYRIGIGSRDGTGIGSAVATSERRRSSPGRDATGVLM